MKKANMFPSFIMSGQFCLFLQQIISFYLCFRKKMKPAEKCSFQEHEKGKYVSLLKASESEEQGMKKANMFPSFKRNKVRNKA